MRIGIAVVFFLSLFGCEQEELTKVCPATCYTYEDPSFADVGACKSGKPVCDENGDVVECVGEVHPSHEICDAIDNDCDGTIDESIEIHPDDPDNQCSQCGVCNYTWERCEMGNWYCDYQTAPTQFDDTCDGRDNDCDCQEDEDVRENNEIVFCYTGPEGTAILGNCHPGIKKCINGEFICEGEVTPMAETCDETDEDCNGFVDDVPARYQGNDIIFGIDVSGSMIPYISAVTEAICTYAQAAQDTEEFSVRMGLVEIARPDGAYQLTQDLTDAQTLCAVLQGLTAPGAYEPTLTAAKAVADPDNPLGISWREDAKRTFIGFSDEPAQMVCDAIVCFPENEVAETLTMCEETDTSIYWFSSFDPGLYAEQAYGCGGRVFIINSYYQLLMEDLGSILNAVCLEP